MSVPRGYSLSPQQRRLWSTAEGRLLSACRVQGRIRLSGPVDAGRLEAALLAITARHEILRTRFLRLEGMKLPSQVIAETPSIDWAVRDLSALTPLCRGQAIAAAEEHAWSLARDLSRDPALRADLTLLGTEEAVLVLTLPAACGDRGSLEILVAELAAEYPRGTAGSDEPGPPADTEEERLQYADLAQWQNDLLDDEESEPGLLYWQGADLGTLSRLRLPGERGSNGVAPALHWRQVVLAPGIRERLTAEAAARSLRPASVTRAAWCALIGRLTGSRSMILGDVADGRRYEELRHAMGPFARHLPVQVEVDDSLTLWELAARIDASVEEAREWQEYLSLDRLQAGGGEPVERFLPVCFDSSDGYASARAAGVEFTIERLRGAVDRCTLLLSVAANGAELGLSLAYDASRIDARAAELLTDRLQAVLSSLGERPQASLAGLEYVGRAERRWLLEELNRTDRPVEGGDAAPRLVIAQARHTPDRPAVSDGWQSISYGELAARVIVLAGWLRRRGVGREAIVGIHAPRSIDRLVAVLAVMEAGGALLPLDPANPPARLRAMVEEAAPCLILSDQPAAETTLGEAPIGPLTGAAPDAPAPASAAAPLPAQGLAYVLYTSGSTGRPKGVAVPHGALTNRLLWAQRIYRLDAGDRVLQSATFGFDFSIWETFAPLVAGAGLVLAPAGELGLDELAAFIGRTRATVAHFVPSLLGPLLEPPAVEDLGSLRLLFSGGEELARERERECHRWLAAQLFNQYGPTEATIDATFWHCRREDGEGGVPIGHPIDNMRAFVADPGLAPVPAGVAGELLLGGVGLARGYLGSPALTARRFLPDPLSGRSGERLYRTGDLARHRLDGAIEYLGRIDQQVQVRGTRIELGEVEAVLETHPQVAACAAAVTAGSVDDRRLVVYLVPAGEELPPTAELRAFLAERLPAYMQPGVFLRLDALPRSASGKLDRAALPDPSSPAFGSGYVEPRNDIERRLCELWSDLLEVERVGVEDDFFQLGGHSLLAMRLVSRVREALAVELPLRAVFESPTVAALAGSLSESGPSAAPPLVAVDRSGELPASFGQRRMWLVDQYDPGSPLYNIPLAARLPGAFDPSLLAAALTEICRRHEVLRTTFRSSAGEPVQVVGPPAQVALPVVDLTGLTSADRRSELARLVDREASLPFDLARGPVFRARLVRLPEEHALLWTMHHIAGDGWSLEILGRELFALYQAFSEGRPSPLPELAIQYGDFAVWQRRWLSADVVEAELGWWRRTLDQAPRSLELPVDRPAPAVPSGRGGGRGFRIPERLAAGLRRYAGGGEATLFQLGLALFCALLWRRTGETDVVVGSPIANRNRAEVEPLIGFFINLLPLRVDLAGDPRFDELLGRVRTTTLNAFEHQDLPFDRLVEELAPERQLGHSSLFRVAMALQNAAQGLSSSGAPQGSLELLGATVRRARFDLTFSLIEGGENLEGAWDFSTDLFDATSVERLSRQWLALLEGVLDDPSRRLSELPLLGAVERHQGLEWNDTTASFPAVASLYDLFLLQARRQPDAVAARFAADTVSYGELEARASRLAAGLRQAGVGAEAPVALCLERSVAMLVATLAVLERGGTYVPLDPTHPPSRLEAILADLGCEVLVAEQGAPAAAGLGAGSGIRRRLELDRRGGLAGAALKPAPEGPRAGGDRLAYVIYTSGSTGEPKGVAVTHRAVARLVLGTNYVRLAAGDRVAHASNVAFDAATFEIWGALLCGGVVVGIARDELLDVGRFADALARHRVHTLFLTTALFNQIAREARGAFAGLRDLLFGGEQVDAGRVGEVLAASPPARLLHVYGPTETTTYASWFPVTRVAGDRRTVPIGRGLANTTLHVLDGSLQPVAAGSAGELYLGGPGLARGYWRRPAATAERFVPAPLPGSGGARLYRTGDLVRLLPSGDVEFVGRIDRQIKLRGFRIELGEIEAALLRHPAVAEAVVLLREDRPGDRRLVGYLAVDSAPPGLVPRGLLAELRAFLQRALPAYMVPAALVPLDRMPLTPNGKIDRRALPEPAVAGGGDEGGRGGAPTGHVEELLAVIWEEVLGLAAAARDDSFFDLGGHSLLAVQMASRIRESFQVELPLRTIFENPTLAEMAAEVEALRAEDLGVTTPPMVRVDRGGELPLSFAQQRLWFLDHLVPDGTFYNVPIGLRLGGPLSVADLAAALTAIVARHEILRTVYPTVEGHPEARILPARPFPLPLLELSGLPGDRAEDISLAVAASEARRPFRLDRDQPVRGLVVRLAPRRHLLLLNLHHIAFDGWSLGVLFRELVTLYRGRTEEGFTAELPELSLQYADSAAWQRACLVGEMLERQLAYWRAHLEGIPGLHGVPTDRPRPPFQTFAGASRQQTLSAELSAAVARLGRDLGTTPFMTLAAALHALFFRYSGQARTPLGSPIANRDRIATEQLIGLFLNTVVLSAPVDGAVSFEELSRRVRDAALGAFAHRDLPFEKLVDELQPERALTHQPLFQIMFVYQNNPVPELELPGLTVEMIETAGEVAKFDLNMIVEEAGERLSATLQYNVDLFDATTASRMLRHFQILLADAAREPRTPVSRLRLLSRAEEQQVVAEWNDTVAAYDRGATLVGLFEAQAAAAPDAPALLTANRRIDYGELNRWANRTARLLTSLGMGRGDRVGVWMDRRPETVAALLGVLKAGAAYVPLEAAYPAKRVEWILSALGAPCLLADAGKLAAIAGMRLPALSSVVCLEGLPPVGEPPLPAGWPAGRGLYGAADLTHRSGDDPPALAAPDDTAYVIFTSGSTGTPKGVEVAHAPVVNLIEWVNRRCDVGPRDQVLFVTSFCFDLSVYDLFGLLAAGASVRLASTEELAEPATLLEILLSEPITLWDSAPAALQRLTPLFDDLAEGAARDRLRWVLLSGDWIPLGLPDRVRGLFPGARVLALGGATEATVWSNSFAVGEIDPEWVSIPYGRPIQNATYHIAERGTPCPIGVPGELLIGGDCLYRSYAAAPALTAAALVPDAWGGAPGGRLYRTGDQARLRPDGVIQLLGRLDHQVKVRGFRIELGEIEVQLTQHPGVAQALALAEDSDTGGKELVAYVVHRGAGATPEELRGFLAARLPEYMVPSAVVVLPAFPLTANGKVDRRALPKPLARAAAPGRGGRPRNEVELRLLHDFETVLDRSLGIDDEFFEAGGNSLLAVRLIARIRRSFDRSLPLAVLFQNPTCRDLARVVQDGGEAAEFRPLVAIQPAGDRPPLFCVHGMGGEVLSYYQLSRCLGRDQPLYGLQAPPPDLVGDTPIRIRDAAAEFVDEVRSVQSSGPYFLCGYSYGAVVAFEMASRLRGEGEPVGLVGLLDGFSPRVMAEAGDRGEVAMLAGLGRNIARQAGTTLEHDAETLRALPADEAMELIVHELVAKGLLPPEIDLTWARRYLRGVRHRESAVVSYEPAVYDGPLTLFRSTELERESAAAWKEVGVDFDVPDRGWGELSTRAVEIVPIVGYHATLLEPPSVEQLARELAIRLDSVES